MIRRLILVAVLALSTAVPAAATAISWQTRYIANPSARSSAAVYQNDVNTLMAASATSGYGDTTPVSFADLNNAQFFGANSHVAYRTTLTFTTATAGLWDFRFGVDYGLGGAVFVDGVALAFRTDDLWWGGNWSSGSVLNLSTSLTQGNHTVVLYGIESCCDGGQSGQWRANGGAWTTFATNDGINRVPEPGMLGLLGAGVAGLALSRRKRARAAV